MRGEQRASRVLWNSGVQKLALRLWSSSSSCKPAARRPPCLPEACWRSMRSFRCDGSSPRLPNFHFHVTLRETLNSRSSGGLPLVSRCTPKTGGRFSLWRRLYGKPPCWAFPPWAIPPPNRTFFVSSLSSSRFVTCTHWGAWNLQRGALAWCARGTVVLANGQRCCVVSVVC